MPELFISDLDGTLLNKNAEISHKTAEILNRLIDQGMNFSIATARTLASAGKILSGLKLNLPIILMNGVLIYNPIHKNYEIVNLLSDCSRKIIEDSAAELGLDCFMYAINNGEMTTYFERLSSCAMKSFYSERRIKYYKSFSQIEKFSIIREGIIYYTFINKYNKLLPLYSQLSEIQDLEITFYKDIYSEHLWYLEVFSAKASKKQGVKYLRDTYGFNKISVFGDNLNDLPMFEAADRKYAVANAAEKVKSAADSIIRSNENDGPALFLQEYFRKDY